MAHAGGHALFIKDWKLHYVYNFLGIPLEQHFVPSEELKPGKYTFGMNCTKESTGPHGESVGSMKLYVNDKVVAGSR
jgi:arylsulfatase